VAFGHHGPRQAAGSRLSSQAGPGRPGRGPAGTDPARPAGSSAPQPAESAPAVPPSSTPAPGPSATPASPAASQPPGGSMPVMMAPGVRGDPVAAQIQVLVASYFTAINDHDFQAYRHLLLGPLRRQISAAQFAESYGATRDSAV